MKKHHWFKSKLPLHMHHMHIVTTLVIRLLTCTYMYICGQKHLKGPGCSSPQTRVHDGKLSLLTAISLLIPVPFGIIELEMVGFCDSYLTALRIWGTILHNRLAYGWWSAGVSKSSDVQM